MHQDVLLEEQLGVLRAASQQSKTCWMILGSWCSTEGVGSRVESRELVSAGGICVLQVTWQGPALTPPHPTPMQGGDSVPVVKQRVVISAPRGKSPLARAAGILLPLFLLLIALFLNGAFSSK